MARTLKNRAPYWVIKTDLSKKEDITVVKNLMSIDAREDLPIQIVSDHLLELGIAEFYRRRKSA